MVKRRFYYEKETTVNTKERGFIEIDMNYTQLYSCFTKIAPKINSATSFKLLFWFLTYKTNDSNGVDTSSKSFDEFNQYLKETCGDDCAITHRTYSNCMRELKESGALTQVQRGHYYANPSMFWQDDVDKRTDILIAEEKYTKRLDG